MRPTAQPITGPAIAGQICFAVRFTSLKNQIARAANARAKATGRNHPERRCLHHASHLGSHTRASSVATAGPGFRTAELRVTSSAQGGRAVWLSVRVAVIGTQRKPWRSMPISRMRGHARRLCRRGRAGQTLILWDRAGSAVIPRLRREGPDARLVVTSAGRILSECGGCGQGGHSQSNNEGFARSHNDPLSSWNSR